MPKRKTSHEFHVEKKVTLKTSPSVPLVTVAEGHYAVHPEGLAVLQSFPGKICPITITGKYRTGKSSLLNMLLPEGQKGFPVGSTMKACTKGLWIHPTPIQVRRECTIVAIDTEGLDALDADSTHDLRIFTLALLLSGFFIYNSIGTIDEAAINLLAFVVKVAEELQVKSCTLGQEFPEFLWVLRDVSLQMVDASPDAYLERALEEPVDKKKQKSNIRKVLRTVFPRRHCRALVRPCVKEQDLQDMDSLPLEMLRGEFQTQLGELRTFLLKQASGKRVFGKELTGGMLGQLAQSYVDAMNTGKMPVLEDSWTMVVKAGAHDAQEGALNYWRTQLKILDEYPFSLDMAYQYLEEQKQAAYEIFQDAAVGNSADYIQSLRNTIDETSQHSMRMLTDRLYAKLKKEFKLELMDYWREGKKPASVGKLKKICSEKYQELLDQCNGFSFKLQVKEKPICTPLMSQLFQGYLTQVLWDWLMDAARLTEMENSGVIQKAKSLEESLKRETSSRKEERDAHQSSFHQQQAEIVTLKRQQDELKAHQEKYTKETEAKTQALGKEVSHLQNLLIETKESHNKTISSLETERNRINLYLTDKTEKIKQLTAQLDEEKAHVVAYQEKASTANRLKLELNQLTKTLEEAKEEKDLLMHEISTMTTTFKTNCLKVKAQANETVERHKKKVQQELKQLQQSLTSRQKQIDKLNISLKDAAAAKGEYDSQKTQYETELKTLNTQIQSQLLLLKKKGAELEECKQKSCEIRKNIETRLLDTQSKYKLQQEAVTQCKAKMERVMQDERTKRQEGEMKFNQDVMKARLAHSDQVKNLETSLACSVAEVKLMRGRTQDLEAEVQGLKKKLDLANQKHLDLVGIKAERDFFEKDNVKKEEEVSQLRAHCQNLERSYRQQQRQGDLEKLLKF